MRHRISAALALIGLGAVSLAAQPPVAGTGTIFMGSYSAISPRLTKRPRKVTKIPLQTGAPFVVRLSPDRTRFYVQSANQEHFEVVDVGRRQSLDRFTLGDARRHVRTMAFEADPQHKTMVLVARTATKLIDRWEIGGAGVHPLRPDRTQGAAQPSRGPRDFEPSYYAPRDSVLARRQALLRLRASNPDLRHRNDAAGGFVGPVGADGVGRRPAGPRVVRRIDR